MVFLLSLFPVAGIGVTPWVDAPFTVSHFGSCSMAPRFFAHLKDTPAVGVPMLVHKISQDIARETTGLTW